MFRLTSTRLVEQLKQKAASLKDVKIGATVKLPDEMRWWYYQEFGTARFYPISPNSKLALLLPATSQYPTPLLVPSVGPPHTALHPPIKAKHFVMKVLPDIQQFASRSLAHSLIRSNYDPTAVRDTLMSEVMPKVVELIGDSMERELGPSREGGKLNGTPPREEYLSSVSIVDSST